LLIGVDADFFARAQIFGGNAAGSRESGKLSLDAGDDLFVFRAHSSSIPKSECKLHLDKVRAKP
jgi:hypothetical protein